MMTATHVAWLIMIAIAAGSEPDTGIWTASPWSQCSAPCSYGVSYREVQCRSRITNEILPSHDCSAPRPLQTRFCSSLECQWGCSSNSTKPICLTASLKQVDDALCNAKTHPGNFTDDFICPYGQPAPWQPPDPSLRDDNAPMSPPTYSWAVLTPFSSCTPQCGSHRFSWRSIACANSSGGIVDDPYCSDQAPRDRQPCPGAVECQASQGRCRNNDGDEVADFWCFNKTGINNWRVESDWSSCSIPTWSMTTRHVVCQDAEICAEHEKPATTGSCPWLPPLTYYRVGQASDLCTAACGPGVVSYSYQCRFRDYDVDNEYCRAAGVPDPVPIPCKTQTCMSNKPCSLHARLNISVPIGAFPDFASVGRQLQLDLHRALQNATDVVVSDVKQIGAEMIEAEFSVLCHDMLVSAGDTIQMQMSDPESAFRRGVITRGSVSKLEILPVVENEVAPKGPDQVPSVNGTSPRTTSGQALSIARNISSAIHLTSIYTALAVFIVVFVFIRCFVRKATKQAKAQEQISTRFSVKDLGSTMPPIQSTILFAVPQATSQGSPRGTAGAKLFK